MKSWYACTTESKAEGQRYAMTVNTHALWLRAFLAAVKRVRSRRDTQLHNAVTDSLSHSLSHSCLHTLARTEARSLAQTFLMSPSGSKVPAGWVMTPR